MSTNQSKFQIDKVCSDASKGTILLVHGTAPQNIDGVVVGCTKEEQKKLRKSNHAYLLQPIFKELSTFLNKYGWETIRYTRLGVNNNIVDIDKYKKTDLKQIMYELNFILSKMPKDKPRIVFAWSGGTIHTAQLPLNKIDAVVFLGGVATKRKELFLSAINNNLSLDINCKTKQIKDIEKAFKAIPANKPELQKARKCKSIFKIEQR